MKVFSGLNPKAIMSLMLLLASHIASSSFKSGLKINFSSSVNYMTRGTSKASYKYFVNMNGTACPIWRLSLEGPLPVYK